MSWLPRLALSQWAGKEDATIASFEGFNSYAWIFFGGLLSGCGFMPACRVAAPIDL
jgi:hypothetical protein